MLRNYYYLNRAVTELNSILLGVNVTEIFSQDKDLLLFSIPTDDDPYRHLVISTNSSLPYLLIKQEHRKAKKNVIEFDHLFLPDKIIKIAIANNDRIISIELERMIIYFSVMGGNTNVYFTKNNVIINQFKKGKAEVDLIDRIAQHNFVTDSTYHKIDKNIFIGFDHKNIRAEYSYISREILNELIVRNTVMDDLEKDFHQILSEIYNSKINLFYNKTEEKIRFFPISFKSFGTIDNAISFSNYNSALNSFISKYYLYDVIVRSKKEINKLITKEMEKASSRLNKLRGRIELGDRSAEFYNSANLLSLNRSALVKGMEKIIITDMIQSTEININLSPKHTPQESIDFYFNKAKDEKILFAKSLLLFKKAVSRYNNLLEIKKRFENSESQDELQQIKNELKISNKNIEKRKVEDNAKLKEYLIDNKFTVLIGRDSKSNDLLSIKVAKQNDYWFHARGLPGSHVVLRVDNPKDGVPKNILKIAAQLAAFHSKAKTAKLAPVSYTFGKYVRKKKGMEPGKVLLMKENVLLVRPEIPRNAVLVTEE